MLCGQMFRTYLSFSQFVSGIKRACLEDYVRVEEKAENRLFWQEYPLRAHRSLRSGLMGPERR
ncbi:MAG TPA: hypothetical protein DEG10_01560 [Leclercia adecarboxylata]|nr:hypothetical protein [Leclercia adecarboxylata]